MLRLLEKDPGARFQSAAEVGDALARVLQRLDVRVSVPLAAAEPRASATQPRVPLVVPTLDAAATPSRSKLPIVAGALTVALAAVAVFIVARTDHGEHRAPRRARPCSPRPCSPRR